MKLEYRLLKLLLIMAGLVLSQVSTAEEATAAKTESMPIVSQTQPGSPAATQTETATQSGVATQTEAAIQSEGAEAQPEMSGFSRGSVVRSIFTTVIDNREPVDKVKSIDTSNRKIYYFTELRDMAGQTAVHRWEYKGKVMAEVNFKVRGPRWRVWSQKSFAPGWSGDWKVSVLNGAGEVISEDVIAYIAKTETPVTAPDTDSTASEPVATPATEAEPGTINTP